MEAIADGAVDKREEIKSKFRQCFGGKIVRKDLTKKIREGANVPVYVLEFLLGPYCSPEDGGRPCEAHVSGWRIYERAAGRDTEVSLEMRRRGDLDNVVEEIETIMESTWLEQDDRKELEYIIEQLDSMSTRYKKKKKRAERENTKIALFQNAVSKFKQKYQSSVSDTQKKLSTYNENIDNAAEAIAAIIRRREKLTVPDFCIEKETIQIQTERVHDYEFNSRLGITEIDEEYVRGLFASEMKKGTKKSVLEMSQDELSERLSYFTGASSEALNELKAKIQEKLDEYFDILSYETSHDGIYKEFLDMQLADARSQYSAAIRI